MNTKLKYKNDYPTFEQIFLTDLKEKNSKSNYILSVYKLNISLYR